MNFLAYYTEERKYSGDFDDWKLMPETGLLIVVRFYAEGRTIYDGGDWYWIENDEIKYVPSGPWGTWKDPPEISCKSCLKQGVGISDQDFNDLYQQILAERY